MAHTFFGRPLLWVNAFWLDGLLIDSGAAHVARELLAALEREGLRVEQLVHTHTDEDHVAANAALHRRFGVTPRAHPLGVPRLAQPETAGEMDWYRRFFWGLIREGCPGEPLGEWVETDRYRFRVIHTPGHTPDHVALFEEREGWLFSGDLYVSARQVHIRRREDPVRWLDSLRRVATLPVTRLFCSHAYKVYDSADPLRRKIDHWEALQRKARSLAAEGLTPEQITRRLHGRRDLMELITGGDFDRRHLIRGLLQGGADDIPA